MLAKALGVEPEEVTEDTVVFLDQSEIPQEDLGYISALRTSICVSDAARFRPQRDRM